MVTDPHWRLGNFDVSGQSYAFSSMNLAGKPLERLFDPSEMQSGFDIPEANAQVRSVYPPAPSAENGFLECRCGRRVFRGSD
jgi:hypothetical protein